MKPKLSTSMNRVLSRTLQYNKSKQFEFKHLINNLHVIRSDKPNKGTQVSKKINPVEVKLNNEYEITQGAVKYKGVVLTFDEGGGDTAYVNIFDYAINAMRNLYLRQVDTILENGVPTNIGAMEDILKQFKIQQARWKVTATGADPEIFAVNSKSGTVIPAFMFLKGKDDPDTTIPSSSSKPNAGPNGSYNQAVFWDGFQAEFNILAGSCLDGRTYSMHYGLKRVLELAKKFDPDAVLTVQSTLDIPANLFANAKPEHVAFGCSPSLNVYNMSGLKIDGDRVPFRSAGGHIHYGVNADRKKHIPEYVKALDKILGVACVSMFASYDNPARRTLYGLAGEYRAPAHGFEYRVLSNAWVSHPTIMYIITEMARRVTGFVDNDLMKYWNATEEETIKCINECNVELAREILKRNEETFKMLINAFAYQSKDKTLCIYNTFLAGMEVLINPETIAENWGLNLPNYDYRTQIRAMQNLPNFDKVLKLKV